MRKLGSRLRMAATFGVAARVLAEAAAFLMVSGGVYGQGPNTYQITPDKTTMVLGETRTFRLVDQNGQAQRGVTWTLSDRDAFDSTEGDELYISPKRTGEFRLTARTYYVTAEATVKVVEAGDMKAGDVRWSSGSKDGCRTVKVIPARPTPGGPDIYEQSQCLDGTYVAAYTSDGVQLWRRKISDSPSQEGTNDYETAGQHLDAHAGSICDAVQAGAEQDKVRAMVTERHLTWREQPGAEHVWVVDEASTQCRLTFDEKHVLVKKKKVFVAE
jgi:hypothetical protein